MYINRYVCSQHHKAITQKIVFRKTHFPSIIGVVVVADSAVVVVMGVVVVGVSAVADVK